jgi:uncharacterized CHY-type Zn-finger protein|tara:strand:+ start:226 stop:426 length:201 start_codon:yes stop_codon:yes gene_type:complete
MKTKEMENFLSGFTSQMFGTNYTECKNNNQCVICGGVADKFTDELSRKEFQISAMCQTCQDNTFGD